MVGDAPGDMGRLMRLAGWVDLDSEITVCWPRRHGFVYTEAFKNDRRLEVFRDFLYSEAQDWHY